MKTGRFARRSIWAGAITAAAMLLATSSAYAALGTGACLAQKRVVWGAFRKCQATEHARALRGNVSDPAKCQARFEEALARITAKGVQAGVACRFGDNGDDTVTDFDTGLMWEKKTGANVFMSATWGDAMGNFISSCNGKSADGLTLGSGCSVYHDWRVPTVVELETILDVNAVGCGSGAPCIDPIFGLTLPYQHWSSTTTSFSNNQAWYVEFFDGFVSDDAKLSDLSTVRAVRVGL
jgi:hypothetical protein